MFLREFMDTEIYKKAKYINYVDIDGIALEENKVFQKITVLHYKELADGGVEIKLWICNEIPDGWSIKLNIINTPKGFRWISNGKNVFSTEYKTALLRAK